MDCKEIWMHTCILSSYHLNQAIPQARRRRKNLCPYQSLQYKRFLTVFLETKRPESVSTSRSALHPPMTPDNNSAFEFLPRIRQLPWLPHPQSQPGDPIHDDHIVTIDDLELPTRLKLPHRSRPDLHLPASHPRCKCFPEYKMPSGYRPRYQSSRRSSIRSVSARSWVIDSFLPSLILLGCHNRPFVASWHLSIIIHEQTALRSLERTHRPLNHPTTLRANLLAFFEDFSALFTVHSPGMSDLVSGSHQRMIGARNGTIFLISSRFTLATSSSAPV